MFIIRDIILYKKIQTVENLLVLLSLYCIYSVNVKYTYIKTSHHPSNVYEFPEYLLKFL